MSTATASPPKQQPVKFKPVVLEIECGNVSFGDETASVGYKVTLEELDADPKAAVVRAYELLCVRQLKGILTLGKRKDGETQGKLIKTDIEITGTFDTGKISIGTKSLSGKLACAMKEVDVKEFHQFAKRGAILKITSAMEALDLDDDDKGGDPDENDAERPMLNGDKKTKAK